MVLQLLLKPWYCLEWCSIHQTYFLLLFQSTIYGLHCNKIDFRMCVQQWLRSTCASALSEQSLWVLAINTAENEDSSCSDVHVHLNAHISCIFEGPFCPDSAHINPLYSHTKSETLIKHKNLSGQGQNFTGNLACIQMHECTLSTRYHEFYNIQTFILSDWDFVLLSFSR